MTTCDMNSIFTACCRDESIIQYWRNARKRRAAVTSSALVVSVKVYIQLTTFTADQRACERSGFDSGQRRVLIGRIGEMTCRCGRAISELHNHTLNPSTLCFCSTQRRDTRLTIEARCLQWPGNAISFHFPSSYNTQHARSRLCFCLESSRSPFASGHSTTRPLIFTDL
jgi:hypothetical protein